MNELKQWKKTHGSWGGWIFCWLFGFTSPKRLKTEKKNHPFEKEIHHKPPFFGGFILVVQVCKRIFVVLLDSSPCFLNCFFLGGWTCFVQALKMGSGQFEVQNYHHWNTLEVQPLIFIFWITDCHFLSFFMVRFIIIQKKLPFFNGGNNFEGICIH